MQDLYSNSNCLSTPSLPACTQTCTAQHRLSLGQVLSLQGLFEFIFKWSSWLVFIMGLPSKLEKLYLTRVELCWLSLCPSMPEGFLGQIKCMVCLQGACHQHGFWTPSCTFWYCCNGPLLSSLLWAQTPAKYGIGLVFTWLPEKPRFLGLGKQDINVGWKGLG